MFGANRWKSSFSKLLDSGITFIKTERRMELHLNAQHLSALKLSAGIFTPFAFHPNTRKAVHFSSSLWEPLGNIYSIDPDRTLLMTCRDAANTIWISGGFSFGVCFFPLLSISASRERTGRVESAEWRLCTARCWSTGGESPPLFSTSPTGFQRWWDWRGET